MIRSSCSRLLYAEMPVKTQLKIVYTELGIKGDTATTRSSLQSSRLAWKCACLSSSTKAKLSKSICATVLTWTAWRHNRSIPYYATKKRVCHNWRTLFYVFNSNGQTVSAKPFAQGLAVLKKQEKAKQARRTSIKDKTARRWNRGRYSRQRTYGTATYL